MEASGREPDERWIEELVRQIRHRKLTLPTLLVLEIARPFSFLLSQGLLLCEPLLGYFVKEPTIGCYADLLGDKGNLDRLVSRLEETHSGAANGVEGRG